MKRTAFKVRIASFNHKVKDVSDLIPCVLLLCQFCALTCGAFSGLAVVGRHVTGLVLSYSAGETHTCATAVPGSFARWAVKKHPECFR